MAIKNLDEQMGAFYQTTREPLVKLMELNAETLAKMGSYTPAILSLFQAKSPEAYIEAQTNLFTATTNNMTEYAKKAYEILLNASTESNKAFVQTLREGAQAVQKTTQSASAHKE
jgi:hypothetical protein